MTAEPPVDVRPSRGSANVLERGAQEGATAHSDSTPEHPLTQCRWRHLLQSRACRASRSVFLPTPMRIWRESLRVPTPCGSSRVASTSFGAHQRLERQQGAWRFLARQPRRSSKRFCRLSWGCRPFAATSRRRYATILISSTHRSKQVQRKNGSSETSRAGRVVDRHSKSCLTRGARFPSSRRLIGLATPTPERSSGPRSLRISGRYSMLRRVRSNE